MILLVPFDSVDMGIEFPTFELLLPLPLLFDRSTDTDCGLKLTDGREITTSEGDGDEIALSSSGKNFRKERKKNQ